MGQPTVSKHWRK